MLLSFFITFLVVVPIAMLGNWARSRRLPAAQRHFGADLLESSGLALGLSTCQLNTAILAPLPHLLSFILIFICASFPPFFLADWIRKRPRNDS
jgi:hypothetical protein